MPDNNHPHIRSQIADGVGEIILNRPEALNAFSREMSAGLVRITGEMEHDEQVRCVLIRAEGDNFMAGGDVKSFYDDLTNNREAHLAGMEQRVVTGHIAINRLRRMRKPVVVAAQGAVAGFGLSLLLAADLAIAGEDSMFTLAYRHVGLTVDGGASYFLPRIVGERRALQIALLGERFSAAQAAEWGILNWVVPRENLLSEAMAVAAKLASGPAEALGRAKALFKDSLESSWDTQSAREAENIAAVVGSADHMEGVTAFIEKRRPNFGNG